MKQKENFFKSWKINCLKLLLLFVVVDKIHLQARHIQRGWRQEIHCYFFLRLEFRGPFRRGMSMKL